MLTSYFNCVVLKFEEYVLKLELSKHTHSFLAGKRIWPKSNQALWNWEPRMAVPCPRLPGCSVFSFCFGWYRAEWQICIAGAIKCWLCRLLLHHLQLSLYTCTSFFFNRNLMNFGIYLKYVFNINHYSFLILFFFPGVTQQPLFVFSIFPPILLFHSS